MPTAPELTQQLANQFEYVRYCPLGRGQHTVILRSRQSALRNLVTALGASPAICEQVLTMAEAEASLTGYSNLPGTAYGMSVVPK